MTAAHRRGNLLSGPYIDRVAHWRKDEARVRAALEDPNSVFVPVWRNQNLVRTGENGIKALLVTDVRSIMQVDVGDVVLLGEFQHRACFAVPLTTPELPSFDEPIEPSDLRTIAGELPPHEAGLLAYARAMLHWRDRNRFCGRCGAAMRSLQAGHVQQCSNPSCAIQQFPRIDPAIIVLITDGERALLGRQATWPPGRYSTIAGFVEPGESLEDAVAREVREETGVEVDSVSYHSSQPWPFPSSLMVGFVAHARPQEIHLVDGELESARWLTRRQIAAGEIRMPFRHSISFRLIEDWYDESAAVPLREEPHVRM
ncbi:MAG: NAD(+) diphosphatase [Xanthomonadaceae bacterium]|nr:NAD(+) diphosphatase [Xanthomonadaceae bacterium]